MKTILVVDDMAILREPIAATLRLKGYRALTAANGQEALQVARAQKPDLILLDVAMPVMDGLACLQALRSDSATSQIQVIMLTAMSEREVVTKAAQSGVAGFLLKTNFSTAELITRVKTLIGEPDVAAIPQSAVTKTTPTQNSESPAHDFVTPTQRTVSPAASVKAVTVAAAPPPPASTKRLTKSVVLQRLTKEIELRSISPVLEYVIALTRNSASTLDDISSAIRHDQALALRVLRVANSSFYNRGRVAKNLMDAVQRIGLTAVRNTVIAILAIEHFAEETEAGLIPQRFWQHSLTTAVLAEMIGEAVSAPQTDHLFLAGLLHDVGRMVLGSVYPGQYAAAIAKAEAQELDLETLEMETFELSHVDATRHILGRWNMPSQIIEAASLHELAIGPLRNVKQDTKGIMSVALANRMTHALVSGNSGNARLLSYHELSSELSLGNAAIDKIVTAALEKTTDMETFYAAQSSEQFGNSLAVELASKVDTAPRIAVLGPDAPADPFSLFFKQLGWLEPEQPTVAIITARSQMDFTRYLPALKKLDSPGQGAVAVIVATSGGTMSVPVEWSCGRQIETISLPCGYSRLVDAVRVVCAGLPCGR